MIKKKKFNSNIYKGAGINDLILFSIYLVKEQKRKCTFERLVKECFSLAPEVFSFSQYPEWPDSRKLDRPLRSLRDKRLIIGDPASRFGLTKDGEKRAAEFSRKFRQKGLFDSL